MPKFAAMRSVARLFNYNSERQPLLLSLRSSKTFITLVVCFAVFTDIFLYCIIIPVVPFALHTRVDIPQDQVQGWVSVLLAIYGAACLVASPIWGWVSDRTSSRRAPLLAGLSVLTGATMMIWFATNITVAVMGRLLQGLSAAVCWITGLALMADTVGQEHIGEAMGFVGLAMSFGSLIGPLVGGVVFARAGYNAVFGMACGLIGLDIVLRVVMVEKKVAAKWISPPSEAAEFGTSQDAVVMPDLKHGDFESDTREIAESANNSLPARTTQTTPSSKKKALPAVLTLLKSRRLLSALWGTVIQAMIMTSLEAVLPLRVKSVFSWSSTGAGLVFLPLFLPSALGPAIGRISDTYGPRWLTFLGFLLTCPFLILLRFVYYDSPGQKALLCGLLALVGIAIELALAPLMAEVAYIVEAKEKQTPGIYGSKGAYAQAYGLFNMAWSAGCLIGPIWGGFINEAAGWGTMSWSLALVAAVTSVPTLLWCGGWLGRRLTRPRRKTKL